MSTVNYAKVDCFLVVMDQFKQDCLRCHNELRKKHGVAPLVLDQQVTNLFNSVGLFVID